MMSDHNLFEHMMMMSDHTVENKKMSPNVQGEMNDELRAGMNDELRAQGRDLGRELRDLGRSSGQG